MKGRRKKERNQGEIGDKRKGRQEKLTEECKRAKGTWRHERIKTGKEKDGRKEEDDKRK